MEPVVPMEPVVVGLARWSDENGMLVWHLEIQCHQLSFNSTSSHCAGFETSEEEMLKPIARAEESGSGDHRKLPIIDRSTGVSCPLTTSTVYLECARVSSWHTGTLAP